MHIRLFGIATVMALAACSNGTDHSTEYDVAEDAIKSYADAQQLESPTGVASGTEQPATQADKIPVSVPQIAYSYQYGFRLPAAEIPKAQQAHVALCESRGAEICRVLNMENSGSEGDYASGMLNIEVAASQARTFGGQLAKAVAEYDGSQIAASISGEDLSKQIVDTEARLRSRSLLAERLTELLRTKKGSVAELVAAERAVTQVNEEIDQARSWLREMRGRVTFSKIVINYQSGAPGSGGFTKPVQKAIGGIASTLGYSLAAIITFLSITLPWVLLLGLAIYLRRRFKAPDRSFWGKRIDQPGCPDD